MKKFEKESKSRNCDTGLRLSRKRQYSLALSACCGERRHTRAVAARRRRVRGEAARERVVRQLWREAAEQLRSLPKSSAARRGRGGDRPAGARACVCM